MDFGMIVGTCTKMEKDYFRLTTAPDPAKVRGEPLLVQALRHVQSRYAADHDYVYACSQLKSIRQDLTVQRIRNPFTVRNACVCARVCARDFATAWVTRRARF
jgi:hypothetical protein